MKHLVIAGLLGLSSIGAHAACQCMCSGGENVPFCTSTLEVPPICAPRVCPIAPPSIAPIQMPQLAPLGTSNCQQRQVLVGGVYQWRTICQ